MAGQWCPAGRPEVAVDIAVQAEGAALDALRWTADMVAATGGIALELVGDEPDRWVEDCVYEGTAGYLFACAQARLGGHRDGDALAVASRDRLLELVRARAGGQPATPATGSPEDCGWYSGLAGQLSGLCAWARAAGDERAALGARDLGWQLEQRFRREEGFGDYTDIISGDAGIACSLLDAGTRSGLALAVRVAERLVALARPAGVGLDWQFHPDRAAIMPNFSHGGAGIAYALAAVGAAAGQPELVDVAVLGARRLVELGSHPSGWALPRSIPADSDDDPVAFGWCHGPTGTARLFVLLDRIRPHEGWDRPLQECLRALRESGLPARLRPGFWDNLGQCCGTAGVGELALDRYQATGDPDWLDWADVLAADVLARRLTDAAGTRWSHTEHRADPSELPPATGLMQGAAGIACWLLRLARLHREGPRARVLPWPDRMVPVLS